MVDPPYRIKNMMPGMIMGWHGSVASIPSGWHLCDGTTGTIDLRDKFIVGAGGAKIPGAAGGQDSQTHTFTGDGHSHSLGGGPDIQPGSGIGVITDVQAAAGTTDAADNRPVFYAMCWIQKL